MSEEIKPKKERRFLKTLGKVGEILIQEVFIKIGSNLIKKIGGKKTLPSILFLLASLSLFAQYPATGNKQRLGFQTTADGLVWRGSLSDTSSIQPISNQNAWVILDTVNLKMYSFDFTSNTWNALPQGTNIDTTSLSNRINLKLNISDTASMLTNYLRTGTAASTYVPLNTESTMNATLNINGNLYIKPGGFIETPILSAGTIIKQGGTSSQFLKANGDVDSSTYLTTGTAASTYLPLTGGTLTGTINGTTGTFTSGIKAGNITPVGSPVINAGITGTATEVHFYSGLGSENNVTTLRLTNNNGGFFQNGLFFKSQMLRGLDEYNGYLGIMNNNFLTFTNNNRIGVFQGSPSYTFDITGTLGVTDATTLSAPLTVNSSAVFNEGSADADFRVESDGNANMVFVDASTDRVGIGTNAPDKTLHVNGEVKIATVTATPTSLLGKDASNVVGEVTDINQSGVMKVGGTTATTNSVGGINVAHGLSYTPSKVIATIAQLNSYVIVLRGITSSNLEFTIYDSTTGVGLDSVSVGFYWIAFK